MHIVMYCVKIMPLQNLGLTEKILFSKLMLDWLTFPVPIPDEEKKLS